MQMSILKRSVPNSNLHKTNLIIDKNDYAGKLDFTKARNITS